MIHKVVSLSQLQQAAPHLRIFPTGISYKIINTISQWWRQSWVSSTTQSLVSRGIAGHLHVLRERAGIWRRAPTWAPSSLRCPHFMITQSWVTKITDRRTCHRFRYLRTYVRTNTSAAARKLINIKWHPLSVYWVKRRRNSKKAGIRTL